MREIREFIRCKGFDHYQADARFVLKGTGFYYAPDRQFDTEHICLKLDINPNRRLLKGHCQTTQRAITQESRVMTFDAVNFLIEKVKWDGQDVPYTYSKGKLVIKSRKRIDEGARIRVDIYYKLTKPKLGLFFHKPSRKYPRQPEQIWTQGQDQYARYWFPCHDTPGERATTEVIATVPKGMTAVSNGALLKKTHDHKKKTSTFHWSQTIPHAPYLVTLAVGRFSIIKDKWKKIPVNYYVEKGREEDARRAFGKTPKMLAFFSSVTGVPYPYAKYDQVAVHDFIYGGMENTSATTQTDLALLDKRASLDYTSDELVAHELAHQWFGDYLTCKDWSHAWLNESFATYFDALFKRHDKGEDEYLYAIYQNAQAYFEEDKSHYRRPLVTHQFKHPSDIFDRHLYEKGSVILYMLHHMLGEPLFWKSIRLYVKTHEGQSVETADFMNAMSEATGRNMKEFFDQWIFRAGHLDLKVRLWWDSRKKEARLRIVQSNADGGEKGLFTIATEILFQTKKGEKRIPVHINKKSHLFTFKLNAEPLWCALDPDQIYLKKVSFPQNEEAVITRLQMDKNPLGRIEAARQIAAFQSEAALLALRESLLNDPFWGVRAEAANAMGGMKSEKAALILLNSLDVIENPKIRRVIYASLSHHKASSFAKEIAKRCRKESSYFAEVNGLRSLGALGHPQAKEILTEALHEQNSWNHIIPIAALDGLAQLKSTELIPLFIQFSEWGRPHRVRMAAIRAMTKVGIGQEVVQSRLLELCLDPFMLVQVAAVKGIAEIGDERVVPTLKKLTAGDWDGRLMRLAQEAIEKINKDFDS